MSRSFLKPCVTPCTALATSARASPCSARWFSVSRVAVSTPSFCSNLMPCGTGTTSLPFGPCTSTWPPCNAIFTPCGTGIGLRPIRDIYLSAPKIFCSKKPNLPNFAQNLAAHSRLARGAAAQQPFWRRQNVDSEPADHRTDLGIAEIPARSGSRNALDPGNHAAAVRRVLQKHAQNFPRLIFFYHLEGRDVALFLQNARNFRLQPRRRDVHALVFGGRGVADARQKIGYGIRLHRFSCTWPLTAATTSSPSRRRGFPRAAPCRENRFCTSGTCGYTRVRGRTRGSGCVCEP